MRTVTILASLVLVLVLGLATGAHAANYLWDGGAGTTNWQDFNNWNPNLTTLNTPNDFYYWTTDALSITLGGNSTANANAVRHSLTSNITTTLTIAAGSALILGGGGPEYSVGYASGTDSTLNVDGTLTMNSTVAPSDVISTLTIGHAGDGVVNVGSGGEVWLKGTTVLRFDPSSNGGTGTLNIDGPNQFYIEGDKTSDATYLGYISAGDKIYVGGSATGVSMQTVDVGGTTYTTFVPEPATIAILGLGCLALIPKRR
jgi:hypothetical protein